MEALTNWRTQMTYARSLSHRIHERKSVVNVDINAEIKSLQRKLVSFSFTKGNHTNEYYEVLGKIKVLRRQIFQ